MKFASATLSSVVCLAVLHFSMLPHKWCDFWENVMNIKYVFDFLNNICLIHFSFKAELSEL